MGIPKDLKLFYVEFGKPDMSSFSYMGSGCASPVYVMARNYGEASRKATEFAEMKMDQNILTGDGSLNTDEDSTKIKSVKLVTEQIII